MTKYFVLFAFLIGFSLSANAQKGWEVGGWAGAAYYFGDLNPDFDLSKPGPALGFIGRYNFNNRLSLRFGLNYANVGADDANSSNDFRKARNLSFNSNIFDAAASFEFNFLPYIHGSRDEFFTPYIFGGLTVMNFNPRTRYNDEWVYLQPLGTEGQFKGDEYYLTQPALNYGFGMKVDLNYAWSVNVEINSRYLFTDFLDDVSGVYADPDDIESQRGELAVLLADRSIVAESGIKIGGEGRQRGDNTTNDNYTTVGIGIVYYFGVLECPSFYR